MNVSKQDGFCHHSKRTATKLVEEIVQICKNLMMNVSRRCLDGTVQPDEVLNQSQLFITTAGYKNTFSYDKLIQLLVMMIVEPEKAFIMGGTYRVPIVTGLLPATFVKDLKKDPTFNEDSFEREYKIDLYSLNIVNCWEALMG